MNILIVEADDRRDLYINIAKYLTASGHIVYYFVYQNNDIGKLYPHVYKILRPSDFQNLNFKSHKQLSYDKFKIAIQSLLDRIYSLNLDIDTTMLIDKIDISYKIIRHILQIYNINVLVGDGEAEPFIISGYEIASELDIKIYSFYPISLIPGNSLLLPCSATESDDFFSNLNVNLELSKIEEDNIKKLISKILSDRSSHSSYFKHGAWFFERYGVFKSLYLLVIRQIQLKVYEIKEVFRPSENVDFFLGSRKILGIKGLIYRLKRNIKVAILDMYFKITKFTRDSDNRNKLIIAIQYRPEASSSVMGPKFCSVEYLLNYIEKNYPEFRIILKDHPLAMGYLRLKTYIRIILSKNLCLYNPFNAEIVNDMHYIVNTSNFGFHLVLQGVEKLTVLGDPIYKVLISSENNINLYNFIYLYQKYCINDDNLLPENIGKIIECQ